MSVTSRRKGNRLAFVGIDSFRFVRVVLDGVNDGGGDATVDLIVDDDGIAVCAVGCDGGGGGGEEKQGVIVCRNTLDNPKDADFGRGKSSNVGKPFN